MILLTCSRVACALTQHILERLDGRLNLAFDGFIKRYYSRYAFEHVARMDVPTFGDPNLSDWA
ncbi:hypothetical protein BJV78DRAFT_1226134 [Lactifluus subvellereus]|nr:hypothetical protein BJV78DRAFT_1226134 [Lactifluus subvellereus]